MRIYTGIYCGRSRRGELNRVSTALSQATSGQFCWGQDFTYDAWANLKAIVPDTCRPRSNVNALKVTLAANN